MAQPPFLTFGNSSGVPFRAYYTNSGVPGVCFNDLSPWPFHGEEVSMATLSGTQSGGDIDVPGSRVTTYGGDIYPPGSRITNYRKRRTVGHSRMPRINGGYVLL